MSRAARQRGQSLVELVAAVPVVLVFGLLCAQALAAGATYVFADNASHAAALALQLGGDGRRAAFDALPGWSRGRVRYRRAPGRVDLWLSPRALIAPLARLLTVHVSVPFTSAAAAIPRGAT